MGPDLPSVIETKLDTGFGGESGCRYRLRTFPKPCCSRVTVFGRMERRTVFVVGAVREPPLLEPIPEHACIELGP